MQATNIMLQLMEQCGFDDSDDEKAMEEYMHGEIKK